MNVIPKPIFSLNTACVALFILWCVSLVVSAVAVRKTSEAKASRDTTLKLADSLARDLASMRTYNRSDLHIADSLSSNTGHKGFAQFLVSNFPRSQPTSCVEGVEILGTTGLKMMSASAKWSSVPFAELSQIIAEAESAKSPFRLCSITLTPSRKKDMVQAEASFITFVK